MKNSLLSVALLILVLGTACNRSQQIVGMASVFEDVKLQELSSLVAGSFLTYKDSWYQALPRVSKKVQLDDKDIPILLRGDKWYYHPVLIAQWGLKYFFNIPGNYANKQKFLHIADWFVENQKITVGPNGPYALWAYTFDFPLHGLKDKSNLMKVPWYSSMAQGQIISVLTRAYRLSDDSRYITTAQRAFCTFFNIYDGKRKDSNWLTYIDQDKYIWLEEYPLQDIERTTDVNLTLNGFIFALWGVLDYYSITGDSSAKSIFEMGIGTLLHYLPQFYDETSGFSYYCLRHKVISEGYHKIHIKQLEALYKVTGIPEFSYWANKFQKGLEQANYE